MGYADMLLHDEHHITAYFFKSPGLNGENPYE